MKHLTTMPPQPPCKYIQSCILREEFCHGGISWPVFNVYWQSLCYISNTNSSASLRFQTARKLLKHEGLRAKCFIVFELFVMAMRHTEWVLGITSQTNEMESIVFPGICALWNALLTNVCFSRCLQNGTTKVRNGMIMQNVVNELLTKIPNL